MDTEKTDDKAFLEEIERLKNRIQELETSVAALNSLETKYRESENRYQAFFETAPDSLFLFKAEGKDKGQIIAANQKAAEAHGYTIEELLKMNIFALDAPDHSQPEIIDRVLQGEIVTAEVMHRHRMGSLFTAEIRATLIEIDKQKYVLSFERDVSARKRAEATIMRQAHELQEANIALEQMALTDGLTGLYNRRAFHIRLDDEIKRVTRYQTPLSLLMIDIDYFKLYNDNYGHLAGDKVLQDMANLLKKYCRESDLTVRYGGEEFAVLMPNTDEAGAKILAERIRKEIEQFEWTNRKNTISGGIATFMGDEIEEDEINKIDTWLIAEADRALYYSKYTGRNKVHYVGDIRKIESKETKES